MGSLKTKTNCESQSDKKKNKKVETRTHLKNREYSENPKE
jgi:hypothetical protein